MDEGLTRKAINLALKCQWKEAIKINKLIIKEDKSDTEALNRVARAYLEIGDILKAKNISKKVLKIEPSNQIAQKAIEKYKRFKTNVNSSNEQNIDATVFLEEVGKTKLTNLINLGSPKNISKLYSGDEVKLLTYSHRSTITTLDDTYIGRLPDDLSARIRLLVKGGNIFKTFVKSVCSTNVKVFIKEIKRGKEFKNCMSFPFEKSESLDESFTQSDF